PVVGAPHLERRLLLLPPAGRRPRAHHGSHRPARARRHLHPRQRRPRLQGLQHAQEGPASDRVAGVRRFARRGSVMYPVRVTETLDVDAFHECSLNGGARSRACCAPLTRGGVSCPGSLRSPSCSAWLRSSARQSSPPARRSARRHTSVTTRSTSTPPT